MSLANAGNSSSTVAVIGSQRRDDVAAINAIGSTEAGEAREDFVEHSEALWSDRWCVAPNRDIAPGCVNRDGPTGFDRDSKAQGSVSAPAVQTSSGI